MYKECKVPVHVEACEEATWFKSMPSKYMIKKYGMMEAEKILFEKFIKNLKGTGKPIIDSRPN